MLAALGSAEEFIGVCISEEESAQVADSMLAVLLHAGAVRSGTAALRAQMLLRLDSLAIALLRHLHKRRMDVQVDELTGLSSDYLCGCSSPNYVTYSAENWKSQAKS